jgi:hypothetical protein
MGVVVEVSMDLLFRWFASALAIVGILAGFGLNEACFHWHAVDAGGETVLATFEPEHHADTDISHPADHHTRSALESCATCFDVPYARLVALTAVKVVQSSLYAVTTIVETFVDKAPIPQLQVALLKGKPWQRLLNLLRRAVVMLN